MSKDILTAHQFRNLRRLHSYFERQRARSEFNEFDIDRKTIAGLTFIERWREYFRARAALTAASRHTKGTSRP
jgi:hypothetical protein